MSTIKKWRIYCISDNKWEYGWARSIPTQCPTNNTHTINTDGINDILTFNEYMLINNTDSPFTIPGRNFYIADTTSGNIIINLRSASENDGRVILFHKSNNNNTVTVSADGLETIDGQSSRTITSIGETLKIKSNGTNWVTLDLSTDEGEEITLLEGDLINDSYQKGDLVVFDGKEHRPLSGNDGEFLKVDSTQPTGLTFTSITVTTDSNIAEGAAIDAAKISDGSVGNTEFQYLSGVSSNIQTQLDNKISANSTDSLTNKTITDNTNSVRATELATTGASVIINASSPPSAGQVLKALTTTTASWQNESGGGATNTDCQIQNSGVTVSTTSTSYIDLNGMSITTSNSTNTNYLILFNCNFEINSSYSAEFIFNINGSDVMDSQRSMEGTGNGKQITNLIYKDTLGNGIEIKVRYKSGKKNKEVKVYERSLVIYGIQ